MRVVSRLPRHAGWELDVPPTAGEATAPTWTPAGGGGVALMNAPDATFPGDAPGHLAAVYFYDDHTIAKYNGPDGQPLDRFRGPAAASV